MKREVYRWRLSRELKSKLEREAKRQKIPVSAIVESAARKWLTKNAMRVGEGKTQAELHAAAEKYIGVLSRGILGNAEPVRETVRRRVRQRILNSRKKADSSLRSE